MTDDARDAVSVIETLVAQHPHDQWLSVTRADLCALLREVSEVQNGYESVKADAETLRGELRESEYWHAQTNAVLEAIKVALRQPGTGSYVAAPEKARGVEGGQDTEDRMNGDDMLRALEAKRTEIDTALSELRHVLVVLSGPTLPETPKPAVTRQEKPRASHKRPSGPTVPDGTAELIVAYVASQPAPVSAGDIIVGVKGARSEHIHLLRKQGRLTATGSTSAMRYSVAKKAVMKPSGTATAEVVWDGNHGGSLSSYQQKARG